MRIQEVLESVRTMSPENMDFALTKMLLLPYLYISLFLWKLLVPREQVVMSVRFLYSISVLGTTRTPPRPALPSPVVSAGTLRPAASTLLTVKAPPSEGK
jgi:hypothetical protein